MSDEREYFEFQLEQKTGSGAWELLPMCKLFSDGFVEVPHEVPSQCDRTEIHGAVRFAEEHPDELKYESGGYAYTSCGTYRVKKL